MVEVECDELAAGCTYRQVTRTPLGLAEMKLQVERLEDLRNLSIRCLNTGTFMRMRLTAAQVGTFVEGEVGIDPGSLAMHLFDAVAGRRYCRT